MIRSLFRICVGLAVVLGGSVASVQAVYAGKILPGVYVGPLNLSGMSTADAQAAIAERAKPAKQLQFTYQDKTFAFSADEIGLTINAEATVKAAESIGRHGGTDMLLTPSRLGTDHADVPLRYQLNTAALREKLAQQTAHIGTSVTEAQIDRDGGDFVIKPGKSGNGIDVDDAVRAARFALEQFRTDVPLQFRPIQPEISVQGLAPAKATATMLSHQPLAVQADDRTLHPPQPTIASWISFTRHGREPDNPRLTQTTLLAVFDEAMTIRPEEVLFGSAPAPTLQADVSRERVGEYVREVADSVDHPPVNGRLSFANGQISFAGVPKDGQVIDRPVAVGVIAAAITGSQRSVTLPFKGKPADIRPENLPKLGITTLIGSATTNFPGSPVNRTYNIGVGARKFDGILIKPGEEFSFNDTLGDVGPETGYRMELVILENKTTPQYGGGLCQVSTTMFRAALDSGLQITDRSNHAYAVHYYAPIGMDATIYPPNPDMKFINNTPGSILVQTSQSGQSLTYEFYGTSDGRKSSTQILYTNATEENGGTAAFRYIVEGGSKPQNVVFTSTYKPRKAFPLPGEKSLN